MSISKTRYGTYEVRWRDRYGNQASKTFARKVQAEVFELKLKTGDVDETGTIKARKTFNEFCKEYLEIACVNKTPNTFRLYEDCIRIRLAPFIGESRLNEITLKDVLLIQANLLKKGYSASYINTALVVFNRILSNAKDLGYIAKNPAEGVKRVKSQDPEWKFWTRGEAKRFLTFVKSRHLVLHDVVAVALNTGLRAGELQALTRGSIDFDRKEIIVKKSFCKESNAVRDETKSKKIRRIPINDFLYSVLQDKRFLPQDAQIFEIKIHTLANHRFREYCKKAGVPRIRFHDLRHTFASHLAMAGLPIPKLQQLMGHSSIEMTMRYSHLSPDAMVGVTEVLSVGYF
jgi:integrase